MVSERQWWVFGSRTRAWRSRTARQGHMRFCSTGLNVSSTAFYSIPWVIFLGSLLPCPPLKNNIKLPL